MRYAEISHGAARDGRVPARLYHGGDATINRFDMRYAQEGALFFTASPRIARAYGPVITTVTVAPRKIAHTTARGWLGSHDHSATDPEMLRHTGYDMLVIAGDRQIRGMHADIYAVLDPAIVTILASQIPARSENRNR